MSDTNIQPRHPEHATRHGVGQGPVAAALPYRGCGLPPRTRPSAEVDPDALWDERGMRHASRTWRDSDV